MHRKDKKEREVKCMKKKMLSCLLAGTMVLGMLSGCGKTEVNSSEASQSSTSKQETTVVQYLLQRTNHQYMSSV